MTTDTTETTATIEVFADIVCPFAHVGLQRLVQRRHELGRDDVRLRVRAYPLEIVNGEPMTGEAVAHKADVLRRQVAPDLFTAFDGSNFPNTSVPALALTHAAYRQDPVLGEQVALELRQLTFDDNVDTARADVLDAVAARHGIAPPTGDDLVAVERDLADARSRGVIGSPHFFTAAGDVFCPTLDVRKIDGELDVAVDYQRFEELVAALFS